MVNTHFRATQKVDEHNIFVTNGAGSAVNNLVLATCDEGDGVLIPSPYYGGFEPDAKIIGKVHSVPAPAPPSSPHFLPDVAALHTAMDLARMHGITIKAIIICTPNNPTGRTLPREIIESYLDFAKDNGLHAIVDEVYALSVFREDADAGLAPFESVLSWDEIPDPEKTHIVWSFSKDFGMSGMRSAAIITYSKPVHHAMHPYAVFTAIPRVVEDTLTRILSDTDFVTFYIKENNKRLKQHYDHLLATLATAGISVTPANAAFFIWIDLRRWVKLLAGKSEGSHIQPNDESHLVASITEPPTPVSDDTTGALPPLAPIPAGRKEELCLFEKFIDGGVYAAPGAAFASPEAGWFRIVYAMDKEILEDAVGRMLKVLQQIETEAGK
ncbi:hypothetical protein HDV00_004068 [Rhizophlyctis rosea]|nr:hypothetical protein HDV00_004068 [Rhizophlyctis rosea]